MQDVCKIVYDKYIFPMTQRKPQYVGVEMEFPVIIGDANVSAKEASSSLLEYLIKNHDFKPVKIDIDGCPVRIRSSMGDDISFDYQYANIEFSMKKDINLVSTHKRFLIYLDVIQKFYKENYNSFFTGMGTHPCPTFPDFDFTQDEFSTRVREYFRKYTNHGQDNFFHTFISSEQTHIDISEDQVVDALNLFAKLGFVRALIFSNSLAPDFDSPNFSFDRNTLCFRDFAWTNCELPNVDMVDKHFESLDDVVNFISEKKMFIDCIDGKLQVFHPVTLGEYVKRSNRSDNFIDHFRMFHNVLINSLSVLEIRDVCIQPLNAILSPSAFSLGLSVNIKDSLNLLEQFFADNKINLKNSELRELVISGKRIVEDSVMKNLLTKIVDLSRKGLVSRGFGEERFIDCLYERIDLLECPALKEKKLLSKGYNKNQIAEMYAEL